MELLKRRDPAHDLLIPYINETQSMMNEAISLFDKTAVCQIVPAVDLGFPHDVIRIAGGFATGMFVEWRCNVPFIPIDTTVNIDTSSIFELEEDVSDDINELDFEKLRDKMSESSYLFNFHKGNHFISFCHSTETDKPLLIIHSNEKEFKYQFNGLMPVRGNWFMDDVKIFQKGERYLRYITGQKAELFTDMAKMLEEYNFIRHRFVANLIVGNKTKIISQKDHNHYFMPTRKSVAIGCFPVTYGDEVPIFSKLGRDIFIFKPEKGGENILTSLNSNKEYLLTPHGWGKTCEKDIEFCINYTTNEFDLSGDKYKIEPLVSLGKDKRLQIREFDTNPNNENSLFVQMRKSCPGIVVDRIVQKCSYSQFGFNRHTSI
ncbi:hypothetical protein MASR1M29_21590 [Cloacibacterium normanense]